MVAQKSKKKLVRELQELRSVSYQAAYNELLGLPPDTSWRGYIDKIREQQENGTSLEPADGPREGDARGDAHREKYPEHQRLKAISDKSQAVGSFLDWLSEEKGIELAVRHEHTDSCYADLDSVDRAMKLHPRRLCGYTDGELVPTHIPIRKLLAEHFEIDEEKIENEKRAMLDELRGEHVS